MTCSGGGAGLGDDECGAVLRDVWLFLDDELDPERRAIVQRHLDDCSPCLEEAGLDSKLKELLARKCGGDHAPERLRERIVATLSQSRSTLVSDGGTTRSVTTVTAAAVTVQWDIARQPEEPARDGGAGTGATGDAADAPGRA